MSTQPVNAPQGPQYRTATIERSAIDEKTRKVELAVSSELAVDRLFGLEVLSHERNAVRLDRLRTAGPLLMDHDPTDQVGVIESARIDSDRVLRVVARFGRSTRAEEVFRDVVDGIRRTVSVGYLVHKLEPAGRQDGRDVYRATDWEPLEVTLTPIPADHTVGVGRARAPEGEQPMEKNEPAAAPDGAAMSRRERREAHDAVRAREDEIREILALGELHKRPELARKAIDRGTSVEKFSDELLRSIGGDFLRIDDRPDPRLGNNRQTARGTMAALGISTQERDRYSLFRVLRALADKTYVAQAGFELEVHRALEADGATVRRGGILVPHDVLRGIGRRTMSTATTLGGEFMPLQVDGFIESLAEESVAIRAGVRAMPAAGTLQLPRFDVDLAGGWVPEDEDGTPETPTTGAVVLEPHLAMALVPITHKLMKTAETTPGIEEVIVSDIRRAIGALLDAAVLAGTGSDGQPLGVLNTAGVSVVDATAGFAFEQILEAMQEVADSEGEAGRLAWVVPPRLRTILAQLPAITGGDVPVWTPAPGRATLAGVPAHVSTKIPVGATTRAVYGNWADVILATWGQLELDMDKSAKFASAGLIFRGLIDADVGVRQPGSICVVSNIATS